MLALDWLGASIMQSRLAGRMFRDDIGTRAMAFMARVSIGLASMVVGMSRHRMRFLLKGVWPWSESRASNMLCRSVSHLVVKPQHTTAMTSAEYSSQKYGRHFMHCLIVGYIQRKPKTPLILT